MSNYGTIAYDDFSHLNAQWQQERPPMAGLGAAYGQHQYRDVSYLNARLRPILPAQVGLSPDGMGLSGGSLMGNSLGISTGGFTKEQIMEAQDIMNGALIQAGYQPIKVDGDLGPATCGAINWYRENRHAEGGESFMAACATVTAKPPTKAGSGTSSSRVATSPSTGVRPVESGMFGSGGGTNWMLWGGAVAAVAVGGALIFRASKKR
jgi:hypothetical protein